MKEIDLKGLKAEYLKCFPDDLTQVEKKKADKAALALPPPTLAAIGDAEASASTTGEARSSSSDDQSEVKFPQTAAGGSGKYFVHQLGEEKRGNEYGVADMGALDSVQMSRNLALGFVVQPNRYGGEGSAPENRELREYMDTAQFKRDQPGFKAFRHKKKAEEAAEAEGALQLEQGDAAAEGNTPPLHDL